jgi:hypothetical protein
MSTNIRSQKIGDVYYQNGNGVPTHVAIIGTVYIDVDTGLFYTNRNGIVLWSEPGGGVSTTTLQQAYNNSTTPEIIINSILDGLSIKNGTGNADNVTKLLEGINTAGDTTSFIRADGSISGTTLQTNGFIANNTGLTGTTISATTYLNLPNNVIKINPVTLTSGSWTLVGDYYQYTFTNVNIVSTGYVDFTPNNASNLEVTSCKLLPEITTNNGNCIFYSQFPPQNNIVGEMIINII